MSLQHARYLEVIDLAAPAPIGSPSSSSSLLRTRQIQVLRLVLPEGHELPTHHVPGEITIQCLSGEACLITEQGQCSLRPGQLVVLAADQAHSVAARTASVLLVTLVHPSDQGSGPGG